VDIKTVISGQDKAHGSRIKQIGNRKEERGRKDEHRTLNVERPTSNEKLVKPIKFNLLNLR
jgi:hypothetical protein